VGKKSSTPATLANRNSDSKQATRVRKEPSLWESPCATSQRGKKKKKKKQAAKNHRGKSKHRQVGKQGTPERGAVRFVKTGKKQDQNTKQKFPKQKTLRMYNKSDEPFKGKIFLKSSKENPP